MQKKVIIYLLHLCFIFFVSLDALGQESKVTTYKINVILDTVQKELLISADFEISHTGKLDSVNLRFLSWIKISKLSCKMKNIRYSRENDHLKLKIPEDKTKKESFEVAMEYNIPIDSFFIENKILILLRSYKWMPFLYDNGAKISLTVAVPETFLVLSTGTPKNEKNKKRQHIIHWYNNMIYDLPLIIINKKYYHESHLVINQKKLNFYFCGKDTVAESLIVNDVAGGFKFLNSYIGKYRFASYDMIEFPNAGYAQSFEGGTIVGSYIIPYYRAYYDIRYWPVHELCHQWIGCGIHFSLEHNNYLQPFMEESLTQFVYMRYIMERDGLDSLKSIIKSYKGIYNTQIMNSNVDFPLNSPFASRSIYTKGPIIFYEIWEKLGDKNFNSFLRVLYRTHLGKIIDYKTFFNYLNVYDEYKPINNMIQHALEEKGEMFKN